MNLRCPRSDPRRRAREPLASRRARALERVAASRQALGADVAALHGPVRAVDAGLSVARWLKAHPLAVGAGAAALAFLLRRHPRARTGLRLAAVGLFRFGLSRFVVSRSRPFRFRPGSTAR